MQSNILLVCFRSKGSQLLGVAGFTDLIGRFGNVKVVELIKSEQGQQKAFVVFASVEAAADCKKKIDESLEARGVLQAHFSKKQYIYKASNPKPRNVCRKRCSKGEGRTSIPRDSASEGASSCSFDSEPRSGQIPVDGSPMAVGDSCTTVVSVTNLDSRVFELLPLLGLMEVFGPVRQLLACKKKRSVFVCFGASFDFAKLYNVLHQRQFFGTFPEVSSIPHQTIDFKQIKNVADFILFEDSQGTTEGHLRAPVLSEGLIFSKIDPRMSVSVLSSLVKIVRPEISVRKLSSPDEKGNSSFFVGCDSTQAALEVFTVFHRKLINQLELIVRFAQPASARDYALLRGVE